MSNDVVMYSYKKSEHEHINEHEKKRLRHSISSLRENNLNVPIYLFSDDPSMFLRTFDVWHDVNILPFCEGFDPEIPSAWSIHRWYNLSFFKNNTRILYVDSDTIFYSNVNYIFDTYTSRDIYGKEERGFRHCPITGSSKNIRNSLDYVDTCIRESEGKTDVYKYCCGVLLLNNDLHLKINFRLNELTELMYELMKGDIPYPLPNSRIADQYAIWILLSRMSADCGLFGVQDVTHSFLEPKHEEYFNPIVLHYTTRDEQKFAQSDNKYSDLIRETEGSQGREIDPYSIV
tara:strand:+ start:185 stop:1051 length:867 start_codon:yes stop_codon:yes gene_type:complete